jgi:hypothetical protein
MRESRLAIRTEWGFGSAEPNELDLVMSRDPGVKADPHLSRLAKNPSWNGPLNTLILQGF